MNEKLLSVDELAESLNVHKSWVYSRTRESGTDAMPVIRVGKYVRMRLSDVLEWLEKRNEIQ